MMGLQNIINGIVNHFFVWLGCKCSDFTIFHFTTNDDHGSVNEDFEFIHGVNAGNLPGDAAGY